MRTSIRIAAIAAMAVGAANLAMGQGPVREGLRDVGQATANVARGVAQGTANVARGVGDAAVGTVRATGDALTPATPSQARGGAGIDDSRDARWRFSRHNGEWWYYNNDDQWMYHRDGNWQQFSQENYQPLNQNQQFAQGQQFQGQQFQDQQFQGQHMAGYRGADQGFGQSVRHDRYGRAYICENGRPVYLDQGQMQGQVVQDQGQFAPTPAQPQEHSVARQNLDQQNQQSLDQQNPNQPQLNQQNLDQQAAPPQPAQPPQGEIQQGATLQSDQATIQSSAAATAPAPATGGQISGDADADVSTAPSGPSDTSTQAQGDPASPREINNNPTSETHGATQNPGR